MTTIEQVLSAIDSRNIARPYLSGSYAVDPAQVAEAEEALGYTFPGSYRAFLLKLGSGDFRGLEFYGLVPSGNATEEIPNALWLTLRLQQEIGLSPGLFVVEDLGDGVLACLDLRARDSGECPVVLWDPSERTDGSHTVLADSFASYLMSRVLTVL